MKYQLVIQFPEEQFDDIDEVAALEDLMAPYLLDAEVDGHDIGCGECNIFIYTDTPLISFGIVKNILEEQMFSLDLLKIAYRAFDSEQYLILWPENLKEFSIA